MELKKSKKFLGYFLVLTLLFSMFIPLNSYALGADVISELPNPILKLKNKEERNGFTYFNLEVTNYSAYPDEMFAPSPDLPPAGNNTSASRTWVEIFNGETNAYIYGFVAFSQAVHLNSIWFARPINQIPPKSVYIKLTDRLTNKVYKSNTIVVYQPLPNPILKLKNKEVRNGFTYFNLEVTNYSAYPDEMFAIAPELPPVGNNIAASRTWVEIFNGETNAYIYGFVGLTKAVDLNSIWFARPTNQTPPKSVYIKITDRKTTQVYKSNTIVVYQPIQSIFKSIFNVLTQK